MDATVENVPKLKSDPYVQWMVLAWPILAVLGGLYQRKKKKKKIAPAASALDQDVEGFEMQDAIRLNGKIYVASPGGPMEEARQSSRRSKHKH